MRLVSKYFLFFILFFPNAGLAEEGKDLYKLFCSQCHGIAGNGKGINSSALQTNPQNHTDGSYMSSRTDKQLEEVIIAGGIGMSKSPVMPSWEGVFTDEEIDSLVKHLRVLCNCKYESIISNIKLRTVDPNFK
jgi:mono/diheme cytochrome c family protein